MAGGRFTGSPQACDAEGGPVLAEGTSESCGSVWAGEKRVGSSLLFLFSFFPVLSSSTFPTNSSSLVEVVPVKGVQRNMVCK